MAIKTGIEMYLCHRIKSSTFPPCSHCLGNHKRQTTAISLPHLTRPSRAYYYHQTCSGRRPCWADPGWSSAGWSVGRRPRRSDRASSSGGGAAWTSRQTLRHRASSAWGRGDASSAPTDWRGVRTWRRTRHKRDLPTEEHVIMRGSTRLMRNE